MPTLAANATYPLKPRGNGKPVRGKAHVRRRDSNTLFQERPKGTSVPTSNATRPESQNVYRRNGPGGRTTYHL